MSTLYAIGLDVGATKILGGLVDCHTGEPLTVVKTPSPTEGAQSTVHAIEENIARILTEAHKDVAKQVRGIGIGLAGQVDSGKGMLMSAPNLGGGITNVALAGPLKERFDMPVMLGNDVEVAAIGEGRFGAGKGVDLFACVFVGTGIGGALMEHGVRFKGATGSAGEIGHMMVQSGGRMCSCGQRGHLEAYSSRTAIVEILREEVEAGERSGIAAIITDTSRRVTSRPLAQAVAQGDRLVVDVITQAGRFLGIGLGSLINLWNPRRIVIGGGVVDRIDLLFNVAAQQAKRSALAVPGSGVEIVRAKLGDNSGMVGAALMGSEQ